MTYDDGPPAVYGVPRPQWDLSGLLDVCGDFRETLEESERVLRDHISSSRDRGIVLPIVNIRWNMTIRPVVEHLRARIAIHNQKVC